MLLAESEVVRTDRAVETFDAMQRLMLPPLSSRLAQLPERDPNHDAQSDNGSLIIDFDDGRSALSPANVLYGVLPPEPSCDPTTPTKHSRSNLLA